MVRSESKKQQNNKKLKHESEHHKDSNGIKNGTVLLFLQDEQKGTVGPVQELQPLGGKKETTTSKNRNHESKHNKNSNGIKNGTVLFFLQDEQKGTMGPVQELQPLIAAGKVQQPT